MICILRVVESYDQEFHPLGYLTSIYDRNNVV